MVIAVTVALAALTACLPAAPATGRNAPVRTVLVMGDSITRGLFGVSPAVTEFLEPNMADRGIRLIIDGFPGDSVYRPWPGQPTWVDRMRWMVAQADPDMIVIQSILMPDAADPAQEAPYLAAMTQLLDVAQSRGAHVYVVDHQIPPYADLALERDVAQRLQARASEGRGVATIPLRYWIERCERPFTADGWHLAARGEQCHALAVTLAVDQLRAQVG